MENIIINRLKDTFINKKVLDEKYDFISIEKKTRQEKDYIESAAYILDIKEANHNIDSMVWDGRNRIIVMIQKEKESKNDFIKNVQKFLNEENKNEFDDLVFNKITVEKIEDYLLIRLLINSLNNKESEELKFNNISTNLYIFDPKVRPVSKDNIMAYQISLDKDFVLSINVKTFSTLNSFKLSQPNKFHQHLKKAQYVVENDYNIQSLRRKLKKDEADLKNTYVVGQVHQSKKNTATFLKINKEEEFKTSKMGVLKRFKDRFNEKYSEIINIKFDEVKLESRIDVQKNNNLKLHKNKVAEKINSVGLNIINNIDNHKICNDIQEKLKNLYNIEENNIEISKEYKADKLNISLIRDVNYYKDNNLKDPYLKTENTQNVTIETLYPETQNIDLEDLEDFDEFSFHSEPLVVVINELITKNDLKNGNISIVDWEAFKFDAPLTFILQTSFEEKTECYAMEVEPSGKFEIFEIQLTDFGKYHKCLDIFNTKKGVNFDIEGMIFKNDNINIIKRTKLFPMPDIDKFDSQFQNEKIFREKNNNKVPKGYGFRAQKNKDLILDSLLDIKIFKENDYLYYSAGIISKEMKANIEKAPVIRKIEAEVESQLFVDGSILQLLNVLFVNNKKLTVYPFPFKYLREYINYKRKNEEKGQGQN